MSEKPNVPAMQQQSSNADIPRMEPWLAITLLAFVPAAGLFILPQAAMIPLYVVMGALMVVGLGMYLRAELKKSK